VSVYDSYSDNELINLLKEGDLKAFTAIHDRYYNVLYRHAYSRIPDREDVKDILQEIFIFLWNNRESLDFSSSLSAYLCTAVRNRILNIIKHEKVKSGYVESFKNFLETNEPLPDESVRTKQLVELIAKEVNSLPSQMRLIFQMSRNEHLSHREIADELNISPLTVKKQINNSLKILRVKLKAHFFMFFL
jgi:RNA polymerase sigma-70 factor (family 1)